MSQAKVDKYKEYKANKAKILKKEKTLRRLEIGALILIAVVFIGWIGFSVYSESQDPTNVSSVTQMDATALDDFVSSISAE